MGMKIMGEESVRARLGRRLREIRKERRISQEKLALESGCAVSTIGRLERGELNATIEVVNDIAEALDIPTRSLFDFPEPPESPYARLVKKLDDILRKQDKDSVHVLSKVMDSLICSSLLAAIAAERIWQ